MKQIIASMLTLILLSGCVAERSGSMPQLTATEVSLKENNYKVLKAGARGKSVGFYLLGLIPIVSPNYADAKSDLYTSVGHKLEGRSVALANQTQDSSSIYLILFSIPKIVITADIVEFTEPSSDEA
jgi:hypothetical protein